MKNQNKTQENVASSLLSCILPFQLQMTMNGFLTVVPLGT